MKIKSLFNIILSFPLRKKIILVSGLFFISGGIYLAGFQSSNKNVQKKIDSEFPTIAVPSPTVNPKPTITSNITNINVPTSTPMLVPTISPTPKETIAPTHTAVPLQSPTPTLSPDNEAPRTNIYYPQNGGTITYKMDGKVCAITTAPYDNQTPFGQIQTQYAFDGDDWSAYATGRAYLCKDNLSNGPHSLKVRSKDNAGNVEAEKVISFEVNIPDNSSEQ